MEEAARLIVNYLYDEFVEDDGERSAVLVRLYKTHPFGDLPSDLRRFAESRSESPLTGETRCLTLLATVGALPEWSDRRNSRDHKAIPLPTESMVEQFPMISQLIRQFGIEVGTVLGPTPELARELSNRTYDAFHVEDAAGSPFIPAQDFVAQHGIQSAVGFGGILLTGDLYATVIFSRCRISRDAADWIRLLALSMRVPLVRFGRGQVFDETARA